MVVYADRGVVVVNKPSGLVCQLNHQGRESALEPSGELEDFLADIQYALGTKSLPLPVHRLDKPTTGALLFALNPQLARDLSQQFQSRTIDKTYLAIVRGGVQTFPEKNGTIKNTLVIDSEGKVDVLSPSESKSSRSKVGLKFDKHKPAETDWEDKVPLSLMKLTLHTGIKRQLRTHMARTLSAPILGDTIFSSSRLPTSITGFVTVPPEHLYLHALQVSLYRYSPNGKRQRVTVMAPLPGYFTRLCAKIGIPLSKEHVKGGVWIDGERVGSPGYIVGRDKSTATEDDSISSLDSSSAATPL
ncbi:hypothetical protein EUX98_g6043 [Antrodiella citrinella]|uniref:Pseudouridine synthase RsuA/RluA-like domain-containing protein n=1 Tax=Antrodiella citrinella TaxID=2447956 RepID=A0A4S4MSK6_9APHY|nr:hypothetical protein EUX98_g6043 [Antrodiella citrinella]